MTGYLVVSRHYSSGSSRFRVAWVAMTENAMVGIRATSHKLKVRMEPLNTLSFSISHINTGKGATKENAKIKARIASLSDSSIAVSKNRISKEMSSRTRSSVKFSFSSTIPPTNNVKVLAFKTGKSRTVLLLQLQKICVLKEGFEPSFISMPLCHFSKYPPSPRLRRIDRLVNSPPAADR